jgi:demethylmenaquinone methyltransferase / 2-methoxy-6-polyprenyl-1,4-benzoquinol methylase
MAPSTPPHPVLEQYYRSDGEREGFVSALFEGAAQHYERVGRVLSFGSEHRYRRQALERAGLRPGMTLLDVATGTGLLARAAGRILGGQRAVVGLDPSAGMLRQACRLPTGPLVQGRAEALPFRDNLFDMLTMGFALRHVTTLESTFQEYLRVLKPGGRVLLLEVSLPRAAVARWLIRLHFQRVLPLLMCISTGSEPARVLMRYYWDTIERCVPPETIVEVLSRTGFVEVERRVMFGILSEYVAAKPGPFKDNH